MNIFISGGCKNGKSMYAQRLAKDMAEKNKSNLYYVATMIPSDKEDRQRILRHIGDREGWGFETIEQGRDITEILSKADQGGAFLLDSVTALLSNEMFQPGGVFDPKAGQRVAADLTELAEKTGNMVFVSDYIYSDARVFDAYTEDYRRALALVDRQLAKICHRTIEVTYGQYYEYRKREEL